MTQPSSLAKSTNSDVSRPNISIDAEYVIYRLEEAGRTLLALPNTGPTTNLRISRHDVVQSAVEAYGWSRIDARLRPAIPSSEHISRMDEALDWIPRIPRDRAVIRRIVGSRALISPITERHLFPWRRLAALLGADHKAIQRWHAQGIDLIVGALHERPEAPSIAGLHRLQRHHRDAAVDNT